MGTTEQVTSEDFKLGINDTYFTREFIAMCGAEKGTAIDTEQLLAGMRKCKDDDEAARFARGYIDWAPEFLAGTPWEAKSAQEHEQNCTKMLLRMAEEHKLGELWGRVINDNQSYRAPMPPPEAFKREGGAYEVDEEIGI